MTIRQLGDYVIWSGAVAGALVTIGILARWLVVRPITKWMERTFAPRILAPLNVVHQEVTENEGRSMKDAIVRIEYHIGTLEKRFEDHIQLHTQAHE